MSFAAGGGSSGRSRRRALFDDLAQSAGRTNRDPGGGDGLRAGGVCHGREKYPTAVLWHPEEVALRCGRSAIRLLEARRRKRTFRPVVNSSSIFFASWAHWTAVSDLKPQATKIVNARSATGLDAGAEA